MKTKKRIAILTLAALVLAGYGTRMFCLERALEKAREAREQQRQAAIKSRIVRGRRITTWQQFDQQLKEWQNKINTATNRNSIVEAYKNASEWANEVRNLRSKQSARVILDTDFSRRLMTTVDFFNRYEDLPGRFKTIAKDLKTASLTELPHLQTNYQNIYDLFKTYNIQIRQLPTSTIKDLAIKEDHSNIRPEQVKAREAFYKRAMELVKPLNLKLKVAQKYAQRVPGRIKGKGSVETVKNAQIDLFELFESFVEFNPYKPGKTAFTMKKLDETLMPAKRDFIDQWKKASKAGKKAWNAIQSELWEEEITGEEETKPPEEEPTEELEEVIELVPAE